MPSRVHDRQVLVGTDWPAPGITRLTLNRPERLNALTTNLINELHAALETAATDSNCRVVVITGSGRGFCAGMDLRDFGVPAGSESYDNIRRSLAVQREIASLIPRLRAVPQPIIAAVNGPAMGAGLALVLGSDIRIAGESGQFSAAYIRMGLSSCDNGVSWLFPRLVGAGRAHELMLTGRTFDAEEAFRIGLLTEVVSDELLSDAALSKANELIANSSFAVSLTKEGMWASLEIAGLHAAMVLEDRQQALGLITDDHREAVADFIEKSTGRSP